MSYPATVRAVEARAVAAIVIASLTIALHDALVKRINDELGIWQLYLLRALFALPLLTALMRMRGVSLRPRRAGWVALRSLLMVTMWGFFYAALAQLSLPVVAATAYTFPLLLALMAAWLPEEHLDARRLLAVIVGFIGVLLMLRPGPEGLSPWSLLPLGSALCYALAALVTRYRCVDEPPLVMSLGLNLGFVVAGVLGLAVVAGIDAQSVTAQPFILSGWQPVGAGLWSLMALLGVLIVTASSLTAQAFQQGRPTLIATCDYSYLPFAALCSGVLVGEWPGPATLAGMALIIGAGILAIHARKGERPE
ncbi:MULTISPECIES: DMT family transporter [Halomonadaceae]|mgnify:CR=1 FL=1|uniref:DMT family transporter n=1 Tax=Modicisalibacter zincidurans TaxID=1178777 RepID=A0ABP9RFY1_9GAMM|nr:MULTISPECIES: DMT family transporter [Halomonas]MCD6009213.1 DMT family transporter [Halomonas sp. IOP_31]